MCGSLFAVSAFLLVTPLRQVALADSSAGSTVLLPVDASRTLDGGPAGWTQTAQITATGCGTGDCPALVGAWQGNVAGRGGVLTDTLTGTAGHTGQGTVTWRSPAFVVPQTPGAATFTLNTSSSYAWTAAADTVPTYTVRLITAGGASRTIVDAAPVSLPNQGWTTSSPVALDGATLPPGSVQRLEISVRFAISSRTGDGTVALDEPTIAVAQPGATTPITITPDLSQVPSLLSPQASTPPRDPAPAAAPASGETADDADDDTHDAADDACTDDHDIAVLGAAAEGRRLSIAGTSARATGSPVDLLSADGWLLGRTAVDADGHFSTNVNEPRASAGTARVYARLADGERSAAAEVQRKNVLQSVRITRGGLQVRGAVLPSFAQRGRLSVAVELPGADPCEPDVDVPAGRVTVDRRTGTYRALVGPAALKSGGAGSAATSLSGPALVRARVTRSGPGIARSTLRSQVFFAPKSYRRGT